MGFNIGEVYQSSSDFLKDRILADLSAMRGDDWMRQQVADALLRRHPSWVKTIDHERHAR